VQVISRVVGGSSSWGDGEGSRSLPAGGALLAYNFDLEISRPVEATREFLAGCIPAMATQFAQECVTEPAAHLSEAPVIST
jgi:hypothetical protein